MGFKVNHKFWGRIISYGFVSLLLIHGTVAAADQKLSLKLVFLSQPTSTNAGKLLSSVKVGIEGLQDPNQNPIYVTLRDQFGLIQGTTTVQAKDGVAEFNDLYFLQGATGYRLEASAVNAQSAKSNRFDISLDIPPSLSLFGLVIHTPGSTFPKALGMKFGIQRFWDAGVSWADIAVSPNEDDWNWYVLDKFLSHLSTHKISEAIYTVGTVPIWASSAPYDDHCRYNSGSCDLPLDLRPDGSGTNQTFISFIEALAGRVNDPKYLESHAHVRYWEIWNEPDANPRFYGRRESGKGVAFNGTYAQLLRIAEDLRCVIKGDGYVHIGGQAKTCAEQGYKYGIDPTAYILMPSFHLNSRINSLALMQNFLYCNNKPKTLCNIPAGEDWGGQAIDAINLHLKIFSEDPEYILSNVRTVQSYLKPAELAKPIFNDESGWGDGVKPFVIYNYDAIQVAFIPRYYLAQYQNVAAAGHYAWENTRGNGLYEVDTRTLAPAGVAYATTFNWLQGSQLTQPCAAQKIQDRTIWTCGLQRGTVQYLAIWDATQSIGKQCDSESNSCATKIFPLRYMSPDYSQWKSFQDYTGKNYPISQSGEIPLGAQALLLSTSEPDN